MSYLWGVTLSVILFGVALGQSSETMQIPNDGQKCGAVNVQCGVGGVTQPPTSPRGLAGPPGKAGVQGEKGNNGSKGDNGAKGEKGINGVKGEIGQVGFKGEKGNDGVAGAMGEKGSKGEEGPRVDKTEVMIGYTSCKELNETLGISTTGNYLLRREGSMDPLFAYCDFRVYAGVTTCHQLKSHYGRAKTGFYVLQPESTAMRVHPFCNFSSHDAITEVWHDMMEEIQVLKKCEGKGCYSRRPLYNMDWDGIRRITNNSAECKQFIRFRCRGTLFLAKEYAWWVSQDEEKMTYWGGATSRRAKYCACGETGSCVDTTKKCNCDINSDPPTQDEGYLTDKAKLPVRELRFGDQQDANEYAFHTIGKLECTG